MKKVESVYVCYYDKDIDTPNIPRADKDTLIKRKLANDIANHILENMNELPRRIDEIRNVDNVDNVDMFLSR